ncbi:MAG: glycerate kinase [Phycisphaeraceae bacterium]|nr:glycerate kinase [Phycisphaeraceae bacterium]
MNRPRWAGRALRVCIAPGSFTPGACAAEASDAMERAVRTVSEEHGQRVRVDRCPIADRIDGADAFAALRVSMNTRIEEARVGGSDERPVTASWGRVRPRRSRIYTATTLVIRAVMIIQFTLIYAAYMLVLGRRGATAVIDAGAIIGDDPDSSRALGQLLRAAIKARGKRVIVLLCEKDPPDLGVGMAAALGVRFLDQAGDPIERPALADLPRIARIDAASINPVVKPGKLVVAFRSGGAPRIPGQLEQLAARCREAGLRPDMNRAGAAGGLGFALSTFLGAELQPLGEVMASVVNLRRRLGRVDVVLTGGASDGPAATPATVRAIAGDLGVPALDIRPGAGQPLESAAAEAVRAWLLA